jgi:hypothetical protein
MSGRDLMLVNGVFRLAYGVGALLSPSAMAGARMVPDTEERPADRLFVRGFGAHQVAVAAVGLAGRRRRELERPAILLAVAIDAVDMVSAAVEAGARRRLGADLAGGLVLSAAGVATAIAAQRRDRS